MIRSTCSATSYEHRTGGLTRTFIETFHIGSRRNTACTFFFRKVSGNNYNKIGQKTSSHNRSSSVVRSANNLRWPTTPSVNGLSPRFVNNLTFFKSISTFSFSSPVTSMYCGPSFIPGSGNEWAIEDRENGESGQTELGSTKVV